MTEMKAQETSMTSESAASQTHPARTICFVQTQAENAGAQEIARQLARGAARKGWDAKQIFFFRRTEAFDNEAGAIYCERERPSTLFGVVRLVIDLYQIFRREAPAAVVTFQHYGNVIAAPIARLAGVRLIIANQVSPPPTIPGPVRIFDRMLGMMGVYDHIVVNSASTEEAYRTYPASYTRHLLRIDHGFHDKSSTLDKSAARRALNLPQQVELLGCAARLNPLKQLDLAIRLLSENAKQHLALAGQGEDFDRLQILAQSLGVRERVHFCGELGTQQIGDFLAALDCFVFPSSAETFGLAPVEAAQAGVPVVANGLDVLRDVLAVDGEPCALFVDAADTKAFVAAVRRVLDDQALHAALVAQGRRLSERYPLDKMIDEHLDLIAPKAT